MKPSALLLAALIAAPVATLGCRPKSVAEAEEKGNVDWLDTNGSPEAVSAMGRLADTNTRATEALSARAAYDVNAYIAAWNATLRGSTWGPVMLRTGLADPTRAETAASVMTRKDGHLIPFIVDLESALSRLAASSNNGAISSVLASVGPAASVAVQRRLDDSATRGSMCRGIGSPDASADARRVLMSVAPQSRDDDACVATVLKIATDNDAALDWLATKAEPGMLSAAGKSEEFPCVRLVPLWTRVFPARSVAVQGTLTVPLENAVKRCAHALDPLLAASLTKQPMTRSLIVGALDPYGGETADLKATCGALKGIANGGSGTVRARAEEAVNHGCRLTH